MITKEELETGYMSGRGSAYNPLGTARRPRFPFARLNGVNDGGYASLDYMIAQDSGHNVEVDSLPTREDIAMRGMGALPSWVPTGWTGAALAVVAGFGLVAIIKGMRKRRKK